MRTSFILALAVLGACGKSSDSRIDTAAARVNAAPPQQNRAPTAPCPATGKWAVCSLEKRMTSSGLVARKNPADTTPRPGFSPKPLTYTLGRGSKLQVFLYADADALKRDVAKIDTVLGAPIGAARPTLSPPVWIRSENLAALLFTTDAREADRLSLAITAGPPQPWR